MAESKHDDPFAWEVDRVVRELCTDDRTWTPTARAKLPDPDVLVEKIRDGEYDGETLLAAREEDLWRDLGITKPKFKMALRHAINQFRSRSLGYREYLRTMHNDSDDDASYKKESKSPSPGFTDAGTIKVSDSGGTATGQVVEATQTRTRGVSGDEDMDEPPKKKKRITATEMITVTASVRQDPESGAMPLPTEADDIRVPMLEARPPKQPLKPAYETANKPDQQGNVENTLLSKPDAYWGNGKLSRQDIIHRHVPEDDARSFGWSRPKFLGRARKKYVNDNMKKYFLRPHLDASGQGDDEVLPCYGDSGEEDDDEWADIEREEEIEKEKARAEKDKATFDSAAVEACLKDMVDECVIEWRETQLPKKEPKAYTIWKESYKHGTRRSEIIEASSILHAKEKRLAKILEGLKDNSYETEADLRSMAAILQPPVYEAEYIKWIISVLSSQTAPKKVRTARAPIQRKSHAKPADGGIDISSEEEHDDFIVDDDSKNHHKSTRENSPDNSHEGLLDEPNDSSRHDPHVDAMDVDCPTPELSTDTSRSFVSASEVICDLTEDHPDIINLITPKKPTSRFTAKDTTNDASPMAQDLKFDDPEAIANKGTMHWESKADFKRLVITIVYNWPKQRRKNLLEIAVYLPAQEAWKEYVEYALSPPVPNAPEDSATGSKDKARRGIAIDLARLFAIYTGEVVSSEKFRRLDEATVKSIEQRTDRFEDFFDFLKGIAPKFEITMTTEEDLDVILTDEDDGLDDVELTPCSKKGKTVQDKSSQRIRAKEQRRLQEQQKRKTHLRQQVQWSQISAEESRLIINESKLESHNLVYVHPHIAPRIKDHQIDGVRFMWDQILADSKQGCLLAHTMGLGKTMQVITLLTAIREAAASSDPKTSCQIPENLKDPRTLILCPAGLLNNWMDELCIWAPEGVLGDFFSVDAEMGNDERARTINDWATKGGVLVIGYTMLTQIARHDNLLQILLDKPTIVVGDEAHHLKNEKSKKSDIANRFKTQSRIALTGSPLANKVEEYYAMIQWVAPDFLGNKPWFSAEYANPIKEGLYKDSDPTTRSKAKIRLAALRKVVAPKVHRRTVALLKDSLPPKKEFIIYLDINRVQREVYLAYLQGVKGTSPDVGVTQMWSLIGILGRLLAHPKILYDNLTDIQQNRGLLKPNKAANKEEEDVLDSTPSQLVTSTLETLTAQQGYKGLNASLKMVTLFKIIDEATKMGENILVFSQSIPTLNFIETICRQQRRAYRRLDGSTKVDARQAQVKGFNKGNGQIYLISTTAGGVGLNIYGASRVVIFDFKFNPVHEQQAIGRAYRIGQTKPVVVYWLICDGTFEKTMHNQQVFKIQLSSRVVDKKNPLPKALKLKEYFQEPQQAPHQDLMGRRGQDAILDALISSNEICEGISSIGTTETFEEEETEQPLAPEEQAEADRMASQTSRKVDPAEARENPLIQLLQQHQGKGLVPVSSTMPVGPVIPVPQARPQQATTSTTASRPFHNQAAQATVAAPVAHAEALADRSPISAEASCVRGGSVPAEAATLARPHIEPRRSATAGPGIPHLQIGTDLPSPANPPLPSDNWADPTMQVMFNGDFHGPVSAHSAERPYQGVGPPIGAAPQQLHPFGIAPRWQFGAAALNGHPTYPQQVGNDLVNNSLFEWVWAQPVDQALLLEPFAANPSIGANFEQQPGHVPSNLNVQAPIAETSVQNFPTHPMPGLQPNNAIRPENSPMSLGGAQGGTPRHDAEKIKFGRELERLAPSYTLKNQVSQTLDDILQHVKGGLQQRLVWINLHELVQQRRNRAVAILNGLVPPEELAKADKDSTALAARLDGEYEGTGAQQQASRINLKDPDHPRQIAQRSIDNQVEQNGPSGHKARDLAALQNVIRNRKSKTPKVKTKKPKKHHPTPSPAGPGQSALDPVVIDD